MLIIIIQTNNPHLQNPFPDVHLLFNNEIFKLLDPEVVTP